VQDEAGLWHSVDGYVKVTKVGLLLPKVTHSHHHSLNVGNFQLSFVLSDFAANIEAIKFGIDVKFKP
jgi:hypothetical protein